MILQKDLKLFRFNNIQLFTEFHPQKFQYYLFSGHNLLGFEYSDNEYKTGLVTIEPGKSVRLELVNEVRDVEMDDENTFVVNIREIPT